MEATRKMANAMNAARRRFLAVAVCAAFLAAGAQGKEWTPPSTPTLPRPPTDAAQVIAATYLGGEGTEWLCGVDFQPDGSVVVAGCCVEGPLLVARFLEAEVLGKDTVMPRFDRTDASGARARPTWKHPNATAFVVRLSPDLQDVLSVVRFPWGGGAATDMRCDKEGNIYVVGLTGPYTPNVSPLQDVSAEPKTDSTVFVAKLSPKADRVLWMRTFTDAWQGPRVRMNEEGKILVEAAWVYVFETDGSLIQVGKPQKTNKWRRGVNPIDYTCALGHFWMTGTGREPWRRPWLRIGVGSDKEYEMYNWPGHLVGINSLRLESDSTISKLHFDDDGMLYIVGWSDGGNTVFQCEPCNIRAHTPYKGLGLTTAGAGALSFVHLMRVDTKEAACRGRTLWCSFYGGKPNSIFVNHLNVAKDKSVLLGGASAYGLLQTTTTLHPGAPGGPYICIMTDEFSGLRFSSIMAACGGLDLRCGEEWSSASAVVNGRCRAAFVSSAIKEDMTYNSGPHPAPTVRPLQGEFGGGLYDGYVILLDLGPMKKREPVPQPRAAKQ